jgi:GntP family gluconate:H+ symporter
MIVGGMLVGVVTSTVGFLYALWITRNWDLARPDEETPEPSPPGEEELVDDSSRPPLVIALIPIVLPVALIALATAFDAWQDAPALWPEVRLSKNWESTNAVIQFLGQKDLAMALAAAAAMITLVWQRSLGGGELAKIVQSELGEAGTVILITAAGGALGGVLQQTGVAHELAKFARGVDPLWILPLSFAVTAAVRTMQGSATVAMVTAVGIFAPLADPGLLSFHPVYLALAIGCGSKPFTWMADSGFWVISRMAGMTEWEMLQTVTVQLALMGFAGLGTVLLAAWLWPLV